MTAPTAEQIAVVNAPVGPLRVMGGFGSGKTTALRARADRLTSGSRDQRVLFLTRSRTTAERVRAEASPGVEVTTFVDFAVALLTGRRGPIRLVERPEQQAIVEGLLTTEGKSDWPTLHEFLSDVAFAEEVADRVLRYEASFLGVEELRVHADAAGMLDEWEQLHGFSERYLDALDERRAVDTAGALVQASMLLRDPAVLAEERRRYGAFIVDDFELATFPSNRLLTQLAGRGGNVTVAGNPAAAVQGLHGASVVHLERFAARFGAADLVLSSAHRDPAPPWLVTGGRIDEPVAIAEKLEGARAEGFEWADMAVLTRTEQGARDAASRLPRGFTVATIDAAAGLEWPIVVLAGCSEGLLPLRYRHHRWFDPWVLGGPDVPDLDERAGRWQAEEARRFAIACSRATTRLVLIAPSPASRFVSG